ncbi:hypothetical protein K3X44_04325 [Aliiroseovarius crassostreae]|uniref:hypothetical protein n=1 Tax=Aliiroseovarius crassostreae TaxID=154981 RepID=UPI002206F7A1|nr:hypothetical protein [Aliiroseovarius crassostreae]UWQ02570.1 hypothetical protein K3X44_04325 [Aliiroseovarius crassostreae]
MSFREQIDEEYDGIIPYHEVFYLNAVRNSAAKSIEHFNNFTACNFSPSTPDVACYEFFSAILQGANLSTLFWPNPRKKTAQKRGWKMRTHFDELAVARIKDRTLRNRISHLDEYLDDFCSREEFGEIIDGFVGDIEKCREPHMRVLRMVDPISRKAIVHGYEFNYSGYFESVALICNQAYEMLDNGSRL